jgi:2-phosphoglycolate phosphatase
MTLNYDAVIFDLDGTLADTIPLIVASFNAACALPLQRQFSHEEVIARFGIPDADMVRRELQGVPDEAVNAAIKNFFQHYEEQHAIAEVFPGINELLKTLQQCAIPLGVMTGKGRPSAEITLRELGWNKIFGSVVTGDDVKQQKPHPEGVLRAAHELNVEPQRCVFIGDSPADIGAGKAAGMKTIAALWHNFYEDELRACEPDFWARTTEELAALLQVAD